MTLRPVHGWLARQFVLAAPVDDAAQQAVRVGLGPPDCVGLGLASDSLRGSMTLSRTCMRPLFVLDFSQIQTP
jgi:hypothetical protein